MSCGTALEARRNSDERWTFTPSSRNYTFSGMAPLFTVRRGETVLLQIDQTQTINGSLFSVVGDSVVLQLKKGDAALLDGPTPDTDAEALFYDVTLTDQTGFENWIVGGPFTLLGLNDVSCGGCNEKVEVTLGGQCIQINIEGGNLGIGASVNLAALNQAVQDAETAAEEAAQSAADASTAGAAAGAAAGSASGAAAGSAAGATAGDSAGTAAAQAVVSMKLDKLSALSEVADLASLTGQVSVQYRTAPGDGYAGTFEWMPGDHSADVSADTPQGVWVAPTSDPTGLSGAWRRVFDGSIYVTWFGAIGNGVVDDTPALNAANDVADIIKCGVFFPEGRYRITDMVTKPVNVTWSGVDRTKSVIYADSGFNMSADSIVKYAAAENSSGIFDLGVECYQSPSTPDRASLINYPRMLDLRATPRFQLDRVRLSGGKIGADITQNSGGGWIGRLETGCTDVGVDIDGPLDFIHIESVHDWLFVGSSAATGLGAIMRDGQRIAMRINSADGLSVGQIASFMGRIVVEGTAANNIPIQFGSIQLDGDKSALEVAGKIVQVANFYSTKGSLPITSLKVSGGRVTLSNAEFSTSGTAVTPIEVTGGMLSINGGRFLASADINAQMATLTGGNLFIRNMTFDLSTSAERTVPYIASTGGALIVQNCRAPITANGGVLISVSSDSGNHNISNNSFQGWRISLPSSPVLGCYGPNNIARRSFTPTVSFATNGDFAPSYTLQDGRYWMEATGFYFQARIVFDSNAYATASGELRIGGFPLPLSGVMDRAPITVGRGDKLTRTANYQSLAGEVVASANSVRIIQIGGGLLATPIVPANLPASTLNFEITISGFIPVR